MKLRIGLIAFAFFGIFQIQTTILAQCPDGLSLTSNGHCFDAAWDTPPSPIPLTVEYNNSVFNYAGGAGTSSSPAKYTNAGGGTCNQGGVPFTGIIEIGGETCEYSGGMLVTPVPIELVEFQATVRAQEVLLNWSTASEWNNKGFGIERSNTGYTWTQIGWLEGATLSTQLISYNFIDAVPTAGVNYYRLIQYDNDGGHDISPVQSVTLQSEDMELKVYPVPASSTLFLSGTGRSIGIWDLKGSLVSAYKTNDGTLDISNLDPGMYILRDADSGEVARFVKQ